MALSGCSRNHDSPALLSPTSGQVPRDQNRLRGQFIFRARAFCRTATARIHSLRYETYMVREWWITTDYLYDREEHLYFRDGNFFVRREANRRKIFWSRGNGWVLAGLARVLEFLPLQHPDRPRFEQLFREMANKILTCQQADGLWRGSLLDPHSYPLKETSGSGFFVFGFAWGVNHGLLDRAKFEPAIRKGWQALTECVTPKGKLTHVQPVGADPK
jgi:unsaturated rhamnogalacturonyl hydrolase